MIPKELRAKNQEELLRVLAERQEEIRKLSFDLAAGRVKNMSQAPQLRRDVARIKTILREHTQQ